GVEQTNAFLHRTLKRLASGNQSGAAGALVNDGSGDGFGEIVFAGSAAAIDERGAAHVTVGHLITAEVNRMIAGQLGINALVVFAVTRTRRIQRLEAAVVFRQLLFDDVRL